MMKVVVVLLSWFFCSGDESSPEDLLGADDLTGQRCKLPPLDCERTVRNGMCDRSKPNVTVLQRNVRLARASYCVNGDTAASWSCGHQCSSVQHIQNASFMEAGNHHGYVAFDSKQQFIILALAGTEDARDWISDLRLGCASPFNAQVVGKLKKYPEARVHNGFWDAWSSLKDLALEKLEKLAKDHKIRDVLVLGHSMGGAIATLAGLDLKSSHGFNASVMSFEAPRCGDVQFVSATIAEDLPIWRITTHRDPVVHLPRFCMDCGGWPRWWNIHKYHHPPIELYWDESGEVGKPPQEPRKCDTSGEDPQCSFKHTWATSFSDHSIVLNEDLKAECKHVTQLVV